MNPQREFISDTFHVLAQPLTVLRATVELGLIKVPDDQTARQVLEDCLYMIDRLMQDLAIFRELASLDEPPPIWPCDGHTLLENCVEEMRPVARDSEISLRVDAEQACIECNEPMFQRAIFVLLDAMIASATRGDEIVISLRKEVSGILFEAGPGMLRGERGKLCTKLLQFSGGTIRPASDCTSAIFQNGLHRQFPAIP
jgi:signal transduction histidine kinase